MTANHTNDKPIATPAMSRPTWLDQFSLAVPATWTFLKHDHASEIGQVDLTLDTDTVRATMEAWHGGGRGQFVMVVGSLEQAVADLIAGDSEPTAADLQAWAAFFARQGDRLLEAARALRTLEGRGE